MFFSGRFFVLGHLGVTGDSQDRFFVNFGKINAVFPVPWGSHVRHFFGSVFRARFRTPPGTNIRPKVIKLGRILTLVLDHFPEEADIPNRDTVQQFGHFFVI